MALKDKLMTLEDFKAVRDVDVASNTAQFTALQADLGDQKTATGAVTKIANSYISLSGSTANPTPVPTQTDFACSVVNVSQGEKYLINAVGGSSARAWGVLDAENNVLSKAASNATANTLLLTMPENASKLIINDSGGLISYKLEESSTPQMIDNLYKRDEISGLFNTNNALFSNEAYSLEFYQGQRNAVITISDSAIFVCSNLIPATKDDIVTVYNLMPQKYKFVVRGFTEDEENGGQFVSGGAHVLNTDLTDSGKNIGSATYSDNIPEIYKNTIAILKPYNNVKYLSIHVRRITGTLLWEDKAEITNCIKCVSGNPALKEIYAPNVSASKLPNIPLEKLPVVTSDKRSTLGSYGELFGNNVLRIDTQEKTCTVGSGGYTVKCGSYRKNNPVIDFSALDTSAYQTIYYDMSDETVKIVGYGAYNSLTGKENTFYLGSTWIAGSLYPNGLFNINTNMDIIVDGIKQVPNVDYFRKKKVCLYGDSICQGQTTDGEKATKKLQDVMGEELGLIATNYAIGGSGWCAREGRTQDMCKKVANDAVIAQYDFVFLFAGTNDWSAGVTLGSMADTPSNTTGNSFYSAVRFTIESIFSQNPMAQVAIVTPTNRNYIGSRVGNAYTELTNGAGNTLGEITDALIEIAEYYNIPVYDMRKNSIVNHLNFTTTLCPQAEGSSHYLHPQDVAYKVIYHRICSWLKTVW